MEPGASNIVTFLPLEPALQIIARALKPLIRPDYWILAHNL